MTARPTLSRDLAAAAALALAAGCASRAPVALVADLQRGPGQGTRPGRVLALSASCGSLEFRCPREYVDAVDGIVRSGLEFHDVALVQPDQLRDRTRQRHETHEVERTSETREHSTHVERTLRPDDRIHGSGSSSTTVEKSTIVLDGPGFDDLTVAEKRALLADAGADAVLVTRIVVGADHGVWRPDQSVEVMVKLSVDRGDTMAWAARCSASSNDFATVGAALENAARCAIHGALE
jgi:hypothetical protein